MDCPRCKSLETRVIKSKHNSSESIRRRRECTKCGFRITTIEHVRIPIKKDVMDAALHR